MNIKFYYQVANTVAWRMNVPGLDRKDKIQECVIKAWLALGENPTPDLKPLIYTIMKRHLISLSRPTYNERITTTYYSNIAEVSRRSYKIVIPLPSRQDERTMVVAWLESDGKLRVACTTLGLPYWTGLRIWHRAKATIKSHSIEACYLDDDQLWLNAF